MIYKNNSYAAAAACERERTGDHGEDHCADRLADRIAYNSAMSEGDSAVYRCAHCGERIYSGDRMVYEYMPLCEECVRNMSAADFCEMNGIDWETA